MNRPLFLALNLYLLLLLGLATVSGDVLALAAPLALYLLVGFWRAPAEIKLHARRSLSAERVSSNQNIDVTIEITNRGEAIEELTILDDLPRGLTLLNGETRHLIRLAPNQSASWTYTVSGLRGDYAFTPLRVTARDSLGLLQRAETLPAPARLIVLPSVPRLKQVSIRPRRTRVYAGDIPARVGGSGVDFFGVREYQTGDSPRRINWHISARQPDSLYANEFEQERVADVGILLDGRDRSNRFGVDRSLFEHSVMACASISDALITQGNRLALLVYGQYLQWTIPGYGKVQRERILQALAAARPGGSEVFTSLAHLPTRLFPVQSQIIVISPLVPDDFDSLVSLRARGYQVTVVSPDPVRFELSYLPATSEVETAARIVRLERGLLLRRLQGAGIQTVDWDVSQPFDGAVRAALGRTPQWLRSIGRPV